MSGANDYATRNRLVRERAKLQSEGEAAGAKLAAKFWQAQHDVDRARETLAKLEAAAGTVKHEWNCYSLSIGRGVDALNAELEATSPLAIDAGLADIALLKDRFRGMHSPVLTVRMSDGTRAPDPESLRDAEHAQARWAGFLEAERELHAMKLEALTDEALAKRLDAIRTRVNASLFRQAVAA